MAQTFVDPSEICTMVVAGYRFNNFESVQIHITWGEPYPHFTFTTADIVEVPGAAPPANWRDLQFAPGDVCSIYLGGELAGRSAMQPCDFFQDVPSGCRAYVMKSVIHDWDDERAHKILLNSRRAVPKDGVLLLVELGLAEGNFPSMGKLVDVAMLVLTGGKERTIQEYRDLLASASFRLNQVYLTSAEVNVIEAMPS